jgi:glycerophosphoryl diester phosphodiesterase
MATRPPAREPARRPRTPRIRPLRALLLVLLLGTPACRVRAAPVLPDVPRPIVWAHRGGAGEAPESTLQAMLALIAEDPAVAIEMDVRRSRDGHLVIIHDATVDRTTNGTGAVESLTLAELQALDAAYCATPGQGRGTAPRALCRSPGEAARFPLRGRGYRIPTLDEVLAALPPRTLIGIEVKAPGFEPALVERLRRSGRLRRLVIGSALDDVSARLLELFPEAPHYFPRWAAIRLAAGAKLSNGHLSRPAYQVLATPRAGAGFSMDTPGLLAVAHRLGLLVAYWTINDPADMETLLARGADALITDYPRRARTVVQRLSQRSPAAPQK